MSVLAACPVVLKVTDPTWPLVNADANPNPKLYVTD